MNRRLMTVVVVPFFCGAGLLGVGDSRAQATPPDNTVLISAGSTLTWYYTYVLGIGPCYDSLGNYVQTDVTQGVVGAPAYVAGNWIPNQVVDASTSGFGVHFTAPISAPVGLTQDLTYSETWSNNCNIHNGPSPYTYTFNLQITPGITSNATNISSAYYDPTTIDEIWWFGGTSTVPGYQSTLTLTAYPAGSASYTWHITGDGSIGFAGAGTATTYTTSSNTVNIVSLGASTWGNLIGVEDVESTGLWQVSREIISLAPTSMTPNTNAGDGTGIEDSIYSDPDYPQLLGDGYTSLIYYIPQDQFGHQLPNVQIPFAEHFFSAPTSNYTGAGAENWSSYPLDQGFRTDYPDNWYDNISVAAAPGSGYVPTPLIPTPPLKSVTVDTWSGEWLAGTTDTSGSSGIVVQANNWQRYQDHGRHLCIASPTTATPVNCTP